MVNVVSYTQKAAAAAGSIGIGGCLTTLAPMLSRLSAGTEMSSYGIPQWNFLLGGGDINAYVAVVSDVPDVPSKSDDDQKDNNTLLLGSLLRVELNPASTGTSASSSASSASSSAAFGMMLVSTAARGKGVAKLLLNEAINDDNDDSVLSSSSELLLPLPLPLPAIRKLLPVCTTAGQQVYSKLGFANVGKVTSLSTDINTARNIQLPSLVVVEDEDDKDDDVNNNKNNMHNQCININVKTFGSMMDDDTTKCIIDSKIKNLIIQMDKKATGYDRSKRLSFMMKNDPNDTDSVKTIVATATATAKATNNNDNNNEDADEDQETIIGAAIIRREMKGGPFVIGPLIGSLKSALPLVKALANAVAAAPNTNTNDDDADAITIMSSTKISVLISDHSELVDEFKTLGSFEEGFNFPAMSLDGKPIYENGDGSYLGLIHPTLG
jgi:hypothetical protein